jgi:distribution and morphology protein 31
MIVFESAIVPKWRDGKISFKKTYISKHPQNETFLRPILKTPKAHPAHTAATRMDAHYPAVHTHDHDHGEEDLDHGVIINEKSIMFDLEIDSVDVELSFRRWLDGKGLVQSAAIKGVRGVIGTHKFVCQNGCPELDSLQTDAVCQSIVIPSPTWRPSDTLPNQEILNFSRSSLKMSS